MTTQTESTYIKLKRKIWPRLFCWGVNFWPCIRSTGGRVYFISEDFTRLKVRLPLNWRTRNRVGTIFGGSMYAATDPFFVIMLMEILGRRYIVWDKAGVIRYRKPGTQTLYADFHITSEMRDALQTSADTHGEATVTWPIQLRNSTGEVYAEVNKTIYVATKYFYSEKMKSKEKEK